MLLTGDNPLCLDSMFFVVVAMFALGLLKIAGHVCAPYQHTPQP